MYVWKAHSKPVYAIQFSPCGQFVLTAGGDEEVRIWNVLSDQPVRKLPGSKTWAPIAWSADGRFVARGGYGVSVWNVEGDTEPIIETDQFTESIAFSPDSTSFVAHGYSTTPLARWSLPQGNPLPGGWGGTRRSEQFPTGAMAYSPEGTTLATIFGVSGDDRFYSVIVLWDVQSGQERGRLSPSKATPAHATQLAYSPDGQLLAGIYGPVLIVWDPIAQNELARVQIGKKHFKGLAFSRNGDQLLAANTDKMVHVLSAPDWQVTASFDWEIGKLGAVAVSANGDLAAAGSDRGKMILWDLES